jgi:multicomponent Na+:H+ antiporter subunit C
MSTVHIYVVAGVLLFVLGLYGLITQPHLMKKIISLNVASAGVFLVLVALAFRRAVPDPVPHALVLTGIVIAVSATAYAVALAGRVFQITGSASLDKKEGEQQ